MGVIGAVILIETIKSLFQISNRYEPDNLSYPYTKAETLPVNSERPS